MSDVSVGEITATLKLRDEMSAQLKLASTQIKAAETQLTQVSAAAADAGKGFAVIEGGAQRGAAALSAVGTAAKPLPGTLANVAAQAAAADVKWRAFQGQLTTAPQTISNVGSSLNTASSFIAGFAGGLATGAVRVVGQFIEQTAAAAAHLDDLSGRLRVSTTGLQQFEFAAGQGGGTLNDVVSAIQTMNKNLAGGSRSTVDALHAAGLELSTIRGLNSEQAFRAIADAIGKIKDPLEQVRVAEALLGGASEKLLAAMRNDFNKTADSAATMSEGTVKAYSAISDGIKSATAHLKVWGSELLLQATQAGQLLKRQGDEIARQQAAAQALLNSVPKVGLPTPAGAPIKSAGDAQKEIDALLGTSAQQIARIDFVAPFLDQIKKSQADLLLQLDAWVRFAGSDVAKLPAAVQKDYYQILQRTVDQFGSLQAAGRGAYQNIYVALDRVVGKAHEATLEFSRLVSTTVDLAKLPGALKILTDEPKTPAAIDFRNATINRLVGSTLPPFPVNAPGTIPAGLFSGGVLPSVAPGASLSERLFGLSGVQLGGRLSSTIERAALGGGNVGQSVSLALQQQSAKLHPGLSGTFGGAAAGFSALNGGTGAALGQVGTSAALGIGASLATGATIAGTAALAATTFGVGAAVVGAIALAKHLREGKKANNLRDDLTAGAGGRSAIEAQINQLTTGPLANLTTGNNTAIQAAFQQFESAGKQKNVQASFDRLKALLDAQNQALETAAKLLDKYRLSLDDLKSPADRAGSSMQTLLKDYQDLKKIGFGDDALSKSMAGGLNDIVRAALETGQKLPAALGPLLQTFVTGGGLADDLARKLLGLPAKIDVPWQQMSDIAHEFGINVDALGNTFRQAKLTDQASDLASKFDLLRNNGVDVNTILGDLNGTTDAAGNHIASMSERANQFVHDSLKFKIDIPANMKPLLQAMADAGELTDDAGNKLTDLSQLKFSPDLKDAIGDLIDRIGQLIDKLTGPDGVPGAIANLGKIPVPTITIPIVIAEPRLPRIVEGVEINPGGSRQNPNTPDPELAAGGIVTRRTRAIVGEAGPEAIIPLSRLRGGSGVSVNVTVHANGALIGDADELGQRIARIATQHITAEAQRYQTV